MAKIVQKRLLGRLFNSIQTETFNEVFNKLQKQRILNPANRDDELLMYMLCKLREGQEWKQL